MEQQEFLPDRYLRALWKGKWLILITTLVALVSVLVFGRIQPAAGPTYQAKATVLVEVLVEEGNALRGLPSSLIPIASVDRGLNTQMELMVSRIVLERALVKIQPLSEGETPGYIKLQIKELRDAISVRTIQNTNLLEVRARAPSPKLAENRANAVVESYVDYLEDEHIRVIQDALKKIGAQPVDEKPAALANKKIELLSRLGLGEELSRIAASAEQSSRDLAQLAEQRASDGTIPALDEEIPQIKNAADSLAGISQDLQAAQEGMQQTMRQAFIRRTESSLSSESSRIDEAATELDTISQQLEGIRTELGQVEFSQQSAAISTQVDTTEAALREVALDVSLISGTESDTGRQLDGVEDYVTSVADHLVRIATTLQDAAERVVSLTEEEQFLFRDQVLSYALGLRAAANDLEDMRQEDLDITSYGEIVGAEGRIRSAVNQLNDLAVLFEEDRNEVDQTTLYADLTDVLGWIQGSGEDLRALAENLRSLEVEVDPAGKQDLAIKTSSGFDNITYTLEIASRELNRLERLLSYDTTPSVKAQLTALVPRLREIGNRVDETKTPFQTILSVEEHTLSNRIGVVQDRIQRGADALLKVSENVQISHHLASPPNDDSPVVQAASDMAEVARSLDVASRQLQELLISSTDPIIVGELGSLAMRLATAQSDIERTQRRLASAMDYSNLGPPREMVAAQWLIDAAVALQAAGAEHQQILDNPDGTIDQDFLARIESQNGIGVAILKRVEIDLGQLRAGEGDSQQYGNLAVLEARVRESGLRATEILTQLRQIQGDRGPDYRERRQLEQRLELSLLQPQNTGIALVDTAVSSQVSAGSFPASQIRVPFGALAGFLLGSLAIVAKAQMDRTVRTQLQIRNELGLAALGVVPRSKSSMKTLDQSLPSSQRPSDFSEALQAVAANLSVSLNNGIDSFLVTSVAAGEGKTMVAVNLAQILSQRGYRVLLIDANFHKPEVAVALNLQRESGLVTALQQEQDPRGHIVPTDSFFVLPAGSPPTNPSELLFSTALSDFLQRSQQEYDVVLVDSAPAMGFAGTKALAKGLKGALLVVKAGSVSTDNVKDVTEDLEVAGSQLVGAVLNFIPRGECSHFQHEKYQQNSAGLGSGTEGSTDAVD